MNSQVRFAMHPADEREFVVAWEIAFSEVVVLSIEKGQLKPVNSGCICPYILEGEVSMNQWIKLAAACKTVQHNRYFGAGNSTTEITELTHILGALGDFPDAILWTQAKSLQAHLKGDLARAILFRKREIEMTIQLHSEVANLEPKVVKFALEDRGIDAIAESKQVLDILVKEESTR